MAAKLLSLGRDVQYWENTEGGHAGAANSEQGAFLMASAFTFFRQRLFDGP